MAASTLRSVARGATKSAAIVGVPTVCFAYYQRTATDAGDHRVAWSTGYATRFYRTFAAPVVMCLDPESAHNFALQVAQMWQSVRLLREPSWTGPTPLDALLRPEASVQVAAGPDLKQELFAQRLTFDTPLGIAAGFDKNALLVPLYRLGAFPSLGFSEVGSVSALPAEGNPQPRCFRLVDDEGVINRMGLNNEGAEAVAERLQSFEVLGKTRVPVGVNIAKTHSPSIFGDTAVEDYVASYRKLAPFGDFVVVNVSCPNTAEGKTFEEPETLQKLLQAISTERAKAGSSRPPLLVKLSPPPLNAHGVADGKLRSLVEIAQASGIVDGYVVSNTAGDRDVPLSPQGRAAAEAAGKGGLSGRPICARSTAAVREVYSLTGGAVPIIGVGGVDSAESAYAKIRAGASLIEIYTGMVYKGPGIFSDLHVGLRKLLERDGFKSIAEAVGADARIAGKVVP